MRPKTSCSWLQNSAASKSQQTWTALPLRIHASVAFYLPRCLCAPLAAKLSCAILPTVSLFRSSRVHRKRTIIVAGDSPRSCPRVLRVPYALSYALETALASLTVGLEIQNLRALLSSRVFTSARPFAKCRLTHSISAVSYSTS